jgi:hypothetical protein
MASRIDAVTASGWETLRDRTLGRAHHRGLFGGHSGGELVVEGLRPDGELVAPVATG